MNIHNPEMHQSSFWDWTFLNDVFLPTKIRVSDIDGVIERNGRFLYIETKRPDCEIPQGQEILHKNWVKQGSSVLRIWGFENRPQYAELLTPKKNYVFENCTLDKIKWIVGRWFDMANKG